MSKALAAEDVSQTFAGSLPIGGMGDGGEWGSEAGGKKGGFGGIGGGEGGEGGGEFGPRIHQHVLSGSSQSAASSLFVQYTSPFFKIVP